MAAFAGCGGGEHAGSSSASRSPSASSSSAGTASSNTNRAAPAAGEGSGATATAPRSTTSAAPTSPSQSRAAADVICTRRNRELKGVPGGGEGLSAVSRVASQRVAIEQRAVTELSALSLPPESAADWKAMITQTKRSLEEAMKLAAAARAGNAAAVTNQLSRFEVPNLRLLAAAARVHARHCTTIG